MGARLALEAMLYENASFLSLTCLSATIEVEDRQKRTLQEQTWIQKLEKESIPSFVDSWYQAPLFSSFSPPKVRYKQNGNDLQKVLQHYSILHSPEFKKILFQKQLPIHFVYRKGDKKALPLLDYSQLYFVPAKSHAIHLEAAQSLIPIIKYILAL